MVEHLGPLRATKSPPRPLPTEGRDLSASAVVVIAIVAALPGAILLGIRDGKGVGAGEFAILTSSRLEPSNV